VLPRAQKLYTLYNLGQLDRLLNFWSDCIVTVVIVCAWRRNFALEKENTVYNSA
jgi:hypothetical protein